jgi:hypothetical protein
MEMKPGFSPLLTTIKYSMDTSGTEESDEETCSKFIPPEEFLSASINEPEADWTSPVQQDKDMQNDPSLILCTRYTELPNNLDQSDTTYKTFCLFPETKETHKLQTKNQQMHTASYQSSSIEPCYDTIKKKYKWQKPTTATQMTQQYPFQEWASIKYKHKLKPPQPRL